MTVLERLLMGLKMFAIGMIMVFLVLFLIIVVIKIVSIILEKVHIKKKEKAPKQESVKELLQVVEVDDSEEIAAVMAAITAYMASEYQTPSVGFKVRSIKQIINK